MFFFFFFGFHSGGGTKFLSPRQRRFVPVGGSTSPGSVSPTAPLTSARGSFGGPGGPSLSSLAAPSYLQSSLLPRSMAAASSAGGMSVSGSGLEEYKEPTISWTDGTKDHADKVVQLPRGGSLIKMLIGHVQVWFTLNFNC